MKLRALKMLLAISLGATVFLFLAGCAGPGVKSWERSEIGTYQMRSDRDPLSDAFADHVYFTREASVGGRGVGGGGCGCN